MDKKFLMIERLEYGIDAGHMSQLIDAGYNEMTHKEKVRVLKKMRETQRQDYFQMIEDAIEKGDWDTALGRMRIPFIMEDAFEKYYELIPDNMKLKFVTDVYSLHGDSYPCIRKAMAEIGKYQKPDLPEWMKDQKIITIYRGGSDPEAKAAASSLSWTTSKDVAELFANRSIYKFDSEGYVYRGKIRTEDILNYIDGSEKEVIQFEKVFDIEEVDFEQGRVKAVDDNGKAMDI